MSALAPEAEIERVADRLERALLKVPPALKEPVAGLLGRLQDALARTEELEDADPDDRAEAAERLEHDLLEPRGDVLAAWAEVRASGRWQAETLLGLVADELPEIADTVADLDLDEGDDLLPEAAE